jgi:hypothetical protein
MNSIDTHTAATHIREFFDRELLPAAAGLRQSGRIFFPTRAEFGTESYYIPRTKTTMARTDFELGELTTVENLEEAMRKLWIAQDYPELVPLAPSLAQIACEVRLRDEQTDEVSPYIYVMF